MPCFLLLSLSVLVILNVLLFAFVFFTCIWVFWVMPLVFSVTVSVCVSVSVTICALLVEFRLHGSFWDFCRKLAFVAPLRRCWLRRRLLIATSVTSFGARSRHVCLCAVWISNWHMSYLYQSNLVHTPVHDNLLLPFAIDGTRTTISATLTIAITITKVDLYLYLIKARTHSQLKYLHASIYWFDSSIILSQFLWGCHNPLSKQSSRPVSS